MIIGKVTKNLPDTVEGMPVNGAVGGVAVAVGGVAVVVGGVAMGAVGGVAMAVGRMVHSEKKMNA